MALDEALRLGWSIDLGFFGGEPLLEWDLLLFCDSYLRSHANGLPAPPRFTVTTNGLHLTKEKAAWLADHGYLLFLSIDGNEAMHNTNRVYPNGHGSHAEAAQALQLARTTPGLMTQAACVVTPSNVHLLGEGVQWLAEHHDGMICLNFDYWADWDDAQLETAAEQYRLCAGLMVQSFRNGAPVLIAPLMSKMYSLLRGGYRACDDCRMGENEICISVDGAIFPCSRLVGETDNPELIIGHVSTGLNYAKQACLTARVHKTPAACLACDNRLYCIHRCGCSNYAGTGDVATPSHAACYMEKHLIETAKAMLTSLRQENNAALRRFFGHLPRFEDF